MNVYVFGLGHIGLPMAVWIALKKYKVIGIDINQSQVKAIMDGKVSIHEHYEGKHISMLAQDLLKVSRLKVLGNFLRDDYNPAVYIITVGIADREDGTQDISPIQHVVDTILPSLIDGDLLIFKTTMIPGTIDRIVVPKIKALNKTIYVAYSPETISETAAFYELEHNERILSGIDEDSYSMAEKFLKTLTDSPIHRVSSIRTAEMVKVVQNIDRDVNIALVNEISEAALALGVDFHELRELANTHPRINLLESGPGVGGYCLPNALKYILLSLDEEKRKDMKLMNTARESNSQRPGKIVSRVNEILKENGKDIKQAKIAVIGLAMKDYCADYRYSPALEIIELLQKAGAKVVAYDSLVPKEAVAQACTYLEAITAADCMIITAKQREVVFDPVEISKAMKKPAIVIDTRNAIYSHPDIYLYKV